MSSKRRYFGTDGIRGKVGKHPITAEFVLKLGWALGQVLKQKADSHRPRVRNRVLIGKDTRISGYMFESALEAGLSAAGMDIRLLGPMPTPAIAYLTRTFHASAGIVISASHNAFHDNGIKFFGHDGMKLPDEMELEIEAMLDKDMSTVDSANLGKALRVEDAGGRYIEFCKSTIASHLNFAGLRIVIDCAHGATYHVAPSVFRELDAEVIKIGASPDGLNINENVGAVQPKALQAAVLEHRADLGIALDGDGDRLIMVDKHAGVVDGDEILYILASHRKHQGSLKGPVVGTLMSNLGLEHALRDLDVELIRAKVGDRYVLEQLQQHDGILGGESSGHIICLDKTTTGDGIISALQVLAACMESGQSLDELKHGMRKYPQRLINVPLAQGKDFLQGEAVQQAVAAAEAELGDQGRVLLRPSGTEPLVRVMVEGMQKQQVNQVAERLAEQVDAAQAA